MLRIPTFLLAILALPALAQTKAVRPVDTSPLPGDVREQHAMIPMRDGVRLSTWLYYPPGPGPFPVLYHQRYVALTAKGTRVESAKMATQTRCVIAMQNFRGSHESEGVFMGYRSLGLGEQKDGYDSVEWFAAQPWCNGKVGTWGGSQGGTSQLFVAATQPPHLTAQYLTDYGVSLFHDAYRAGGVTRAQRFLARVALDARDPADGRATVEDQLKHPLYDDWWAVENAAPHFDKMNYPAVLLGGWFDPVHKAVIQGFHGREKFFPGKSWLILGPWSHGSSYRNSPKVGDLTFPDNAPFDPRAHMAKWFAHHLLGEDNHVTDEPRVRYYTMGACNEPGAPGNQWRTATTFPPAYTATPFFLAANGKLAAAAPSEANGSSTYTSDPTKPNKISGASYPGAMDQRAFEQHGDVLTFTTDALTEPMEWTGLVTARIFLSSTAKDTDVIVRLTDVYPDGRSVLLMDHVRRARYREGLDKDTPLEPGKIYPITLDVGYLSMVFNRGHKIRVTIASTGDDWYEPNPQTGAPVTTEPPKEFVTARNTIHHDRDHPSQILAPIYHP